MPYDANDPRSALSTAGATPTGVPRAATYRQLHDGPADVTESGGGATWWTRSQAMVIAFTEALPGDRLVAETAGEYGLLVLDGAGVDVHHDSGDVTVDRDSVIVVPPGASDVEVTRAGNVVRVFAAGLEPELAAQCVNHDDYDPADHNVADYQPWPDPPDGHRVRAYELADHPSEPGRLGSIFRCSTVMINVFDPHDEPRDPTMMSPHHHDDFEQVSVQMDGNYVHHMRAPWTPDLTTWRDDEHHHSKGPSIVVIPPPIVHTSQAVDHMRHFLIDVFAPPRIDFSERPGWVLNADDYPLP